MRKPNQLQRFFHALFYIFFGELQVSGTKRDVLKNGLRKKLPLGVLHHIANDAMQKATVFLGIRGYPVNGNATGVRNFKGAQKAGERGLS